MKYSLIRLGLFVTVVLMVVIGSVLTQLYPAFILLAGIFGSVLIGLVGWVLQLTIDAELEKRIKDKDE